MSRRTTLALAAATLMLGVGAYAWLQPSTGDGTAASSADGPVVRVLKTPTCACCSEWTNHLNQNGFRVESENMGAAELVRAKQERGVPQDLFACHTAVVEGYVVEGHVPATDIRRLLQERPHEVAGLAVAGMPVGSPGMERGDRREPYDVIAFGRDEARRIYASH